ncbi:hypothetical protein ACFVUN_34800 [Kitasatospora griseola]|uniref:hypothetical protein n=1 Tax=Kitasatospora griseola TaxID=2064 RepID=UPI0036DD6A3D
MDESRAPRGLEGGPGGPGWDGVERRGAGRGRAAGRWWEAWRSPGRMRGQIAATVVGGLLLAAVLGLVRLLATHVHITIR